MAYCIRIFSIWLVCLMSVISQGPYAWADPAPLALVWRGPGACKLFCGQSAVNTTRMAGFRTLSVYPGFHDEALFREAKLWVQPGGRSTLAATSMGPELMEHVRRFVADGGAYVGFCAGMYLTTAHIGTTDQAGFGFVPGRTDLYLPDSQDPIGILVPLTLDQGVYNSLYFGGPKLLASESELHAAGAQVIAHYADGSIAGVELPYGRGRVAVIGAHPEANWGWKALSGNATRHTARWLALEMIKWATSAEN
jgi:glutamine amidotransferase-like uncharacterized protein